MKYIHLVIVFSFLLLYSSCAEPPVSSSPLSTQSGEVLSHEVQEVKLSSGSSFSLTLGKVSHTLGGTSLQMLAYNGSIPGPILRVDQGSQVTLEVKNTLDEPTMLHPHGIRAENSADGTHLVQHEIMPGETFTQKLSFPDAGVYWYHPHMGEVAGQDLGLYGMFIVTPKDTQEWEPVHKEIPLVFDDILLGRNGMPLISKETTRTLMGTYGNVMLANGVDNLNFQIKKGEVVRFYLLNSANTRPFRLHIPGVQMKRIGGDNGLYEEETFENYIVLGPSERAIVDVYFPSAGDFQWEHEAEGKYTMATLHVTENEVSRDYSQRFSVLAAHTSVKKEIAAFLQQKILQEEKLSFTVDMGMNGMQHGGMMHMPCHTMPDGTQMGECASTSSSELKGIEWEDAMSMMNSVSTKDSVKWKIIDDSTKKVNQDIHWSFMQSAPVKITLYNDPTSPHPMQHPFHIHGNRFLVLSRDGKEEVNRVWKDTVLVKSGERVELLLDTSNPGKWMMHCHISEHLEDGMFGYFDVQPRP